MPVAFVQDENLWTKAKQQAQAQGKTGDYAYITGVYKQLGGKVGKEEAVGQSSMGQLNRNRPSWAESVKGNFESFQPVAIDPSKRQVRCLIVTEGPGNSRDKNYYTAEAIQDAVVKFNGARSMINHQTAEERASRPEQDVWHQAGFFMDLALVKVPNEEGKLVAGCEATLTFDASPAGDEGLAKAQAAILYQQQFPEGQEVYAGLSINAMGVIDGTMEVDGEDDWNKVVGFERVSSADVVTRPARGGRFQKMLESVAHVEATFTREGSMDKKELIKKIRSLEAKVKAEKDRKARNILEAKVQEARQSLAELALLEAEDEGDGDGGKAGQDGKTPEEEETEGKLAMKKALSKHIPKGADESENEYEARLAKIHAAVGGSGKGEEAEDGDKKGKESLTEAALREALDAERSKDGRALLESNRKLAGELRRYKMSEAAVKLLAESELPEGILTVDDLLEASNVDGMVRMIARHERISQRFTPAGTPQRSADGVRGKGRGLSRESLAEAGLPTRGEA